MEKYDWNAYEGAKGGNIGILEKVEIVLKLVKTVKDMEEAYVQHRDIKPQNIVYRIRGNTLDVKLIDFGIGRGTNQIEGTPGFSPVDFRGGYGCDFQSLAVTISFFLFDLTDKSFWNGMFRPIVDEAANDSPRKIFENDIKNNTFQEQAFDIIQRFMDMKDGDKIKVKKLKF